MNSFTLKLIGIATMLCDHLGKVFWQNAIWLQYIGRLAFPIFAFGIAQGYIHTKNIKKYIRRLAIFAAISQIPYMLFLSTSNGNLAKLNIIFTLLLGLATIYFYDNLKNKWFGLGFILLMCCIAELLKVDYGAYGIATIFLFYWYSKLLIKKPQTKQRTIYSVIMLAIFIIMTILHYLSSIIQYPDAITNWLWLIIWTSMSAILIISYNGKLGLKCKYLFYIFYPTHLLIIYLIWLFIK